MTNERPPVGESRWVLPALFGWLATALALAFAAAQVAPGGWRRTTAVLLMVIVGVAGPFVLRLPRRAQHPARLRYGRSIGLASMGTLVMAAVVVATVLPTPRSPEAPESAPPSSPTADPLNPPASASRGPNPDFKNVVASLDLLKNGDPIEAADSYLLPYGLTVPNPEYVGWCGEPSTTIFRKRGAYVGGYARALIQNTNDQGNSESVQILDIRTKVISSTEPRGGIKVLCVKTQGDAPEKADLRAEEGRLALTGLENKSPIPLSFELAPGEQQVVNLNLLPGQKDNLIDILADAVIRGEKSEILLTKQPLLIRSDSSAEFQLNIVGNNPSSSDASFVCVLVSTEQPCDPSDPRAPRL